MDNHNLIAICADRWKQIQHLNDLDLRSLVLAVTAVTGAVVSAKATPPFPVILEAGVALLASAVCAGGIHSTVHNRISMEYALAAIDFVERKLNEATPGLFPFAGNYSAPANRRQFILRILKSIRGPMVIFFSLALGVAFAAFCHAIFKLVTVPWFDEKLLAMAAGVAASIIVVVLLFGLAWSSAEKAFLPPASINSKKP